MERTYVSGLVSIIMPVYNAEKYLRASINSVLKQTYKNWELIIVDDGSTDGSDAICDYYDTYQRIKVYHLINGGVSRARNYGLDKACGEYIVFLDSDDLLESSFIDKLVGQMSEPDVDMVGCLSALIDSNLSEYVCTDEAGEFINCTNAYSANIPELFGSVVWAKIYRLSVIRKNNLKFCSELSIGEDTLFFQEYSLVCKKMMMYSGPLIGYRVVLNSLSRKRIIPTPFVQNITRLSILESFVKEKNISEKKSDKYLVRCLMCVVESLFIYSKYKEDFNYNWNILRGNKELFQRLKIIARTGTGRVRLSMRIVDICMALNWRYGAWQVIKIIFRNNE